MRNFWFWGLIGAVLWAYSCATPVAPTGGDRDTTPPKLQAEDSTPDEQTNFRPIQIELTYDEWLQLKDLTKEVIVSPPLEYRPTIDLRKKTVRFTFDEREVLRDSATYTINFGDAIQDLNEGNSAAARFVFATGPYIDSLQLKATVKDALTDKPLENALVMLYEDLRDSVVYDALPFYFAKTDKQGRATLRNLRAGTYRAVALTDGNQNYRLDGAKEQIGFPDNLITVGSDTSSTLALRVFLEDPPQRITRKDTKQYGLVNLTFADTPTDVTLQTSETPGLQTFTEVVKDSLYIWYTYEGSDDWALYYERPNRTDTITVPPRATSTLAFGQRLEQVDPARQTVSLIGNDAASFRFSHPVFSISPDSVQIFRDTLPEAIAPTTAIPDTADLRGVQIRFRRQGGSEYRVRLLPYAVTDIFGYANTDTLEQRYRAVPEEEVSRLTLEVADLDSTKQYVFRFGQAKREPIRTFIISGKRQTTLALPPLLADSYELEVIEDTNRDGRWSTGSYIEGRQPERTFAQKIGPLRENWEQVETVKLNFDRPAAPAARPSSTPTAPRPRNRQ